MQFIVCLIYFPVLLLYYIMLIEIIFKLKWDYHILVSNMYNWLFRVLCFFSPFFSFMQCRVGRTARLGEKGDSILFLQPIEIDYLEDLKKHGVTLTEYPLLKILSSFALYNQKNQLAKKFVSIEMHPWLLSLQRGLESFISSKVLSPLWCLSTFLQSCAAWESIHSNAKLSSNQTSDTSLAKEAVWLA